MKKKAIIAACILLAVGGTFLIMGAAGGGQPMAQGKEVTLTGKLSCTFCTMAHPDKPCPPGCCANCVKAGDPPSLTDALGNMYILLTGEMATPLMTPERIAMLGSQATVKGLLVKRDGIQAIYVQSMEKVESKQVSIQGRLSCTFCTLAHPDTPCPPGCCANCVKAGDPPSLTDASGRVYLLLTHEMATPLMTPERIAMLGSQAVVKGLLVSRNGINAIFVDSIERAGMAAAQ